MLSVYSVQIIPHMPIVSLAINELFLLLLDYVDSSKEKNSAIVLICYYHSYI